ncbi:MAG: hypothetical protein NTX19_11695 [Gemmatimonadetes bacterium]|nr:hypothetical protein [Gemmatimonadota bacterium]
MVTKDDLETFLDRLDSTGATYSEVSEGLWNIRPAGDLDFGVVVHHSPPVVVLRVNVMGLPQDKEKLAALCRRLLELNASDLLHGSYGIQKESVVLTDALELSHLDYEEFRAAYESITLALASNIRELSTYREAR